MQESESAAHQGGSVTGAVAPLDISSMPLLLTSGKTYSYGTPDRFGRPVKMEEVEVFAKGKKNKLFVDDANDLLKMLNIQDELPSRISNESDEDLLDNIVKQLQDQDIDASWNDAMDIG